ncbi:rabankyrin-5 isoform X2 [Drosophila biarmipes]|uniref:rabankyrin-5 isoform X2 n=1 Tax=Drosophila biarmipes TaxID=125945 RepID=UPI0021CCC51F|nr:rabankyrin-5 isoform X2 [Drosophila biarmipes]
MGRNDGSTVQKLEKHLTLLKEEYSKQQRSYAELQRKYNEITATSKNEELSGGLNNLFSRLSKTVALLFGSHTYADINIRTHSKVFPAHKIVLHARSEKWGDGDLGSKQELDWSDFNEDAVFALLRWIYTDLIDLQHDGLALDLLRAAHRFGLPSLLEMCETALVASVGVRSCIKFYCVADEVGALTLLQYCSEIISTHWDDLARQDFEYMSGPLLFKMLKNKTKYPLHSAVRLLREDVVYLCIQENSDAMALSAKSYKIAQTLVKNGMANINAVDIEGLPLLIAALKNNDVFSAHFLLDQNCLVDLSSKTSSDTALHVICNYKEFKNSSNNAADILNIGIKILEKNPNVNIKNLKGETPLHIAIIRQNLQMVDLLLKVPNIDINLRTFDEKSALELCLSLDDQDFKTASMLINMGAQPNAIKTKTGDSLLQVFAMDGYRGEKAAIFLADYTNLDHFNLRGLTALHIASLNNLPNLVKKLVVNGASCNLQSIDAGLKSALHIAVEANAVEALEAFVHLKNNLSYVIDFNSKDINGDSPLSLALNKTSLVPILIRGGSDVNAKNKNNLTLLHQSIKNRDSDTCLFLLEQGADFTAVTDDQDSVLDLSIKYDLPRVVDALCTRGVALASEKSGVSPLWTALELGFEDVANILVQHGVDTDSWDKGPEECQQTLLHRAIDESKESIAIFLIQNQCDLDSSRQLGPNGEGGHEAQQKASPLHLCCQCGLTKVLQTLIDHGANVNVVDSKNKSPLHIAIENQHEEIISILLCHPDIDLKLRDMSGNTPFAAALSIRNDKAAQRILVRFPTAAEQMDSRGRSFLHLAIMKDDLESVLFLLAIQVDVNSRVHDVNQSTPLHLAAASHNEMITRNLILAGARMNERDAVQKLPLHIAIERGNLPAVSALIQNNADFDATDADGNNALHIAVRYSQLFIVRELLTESRVNAEATNLKGRNPMHELCRIVEDNTAALICELFLECMPKYPINMPDMDGNTPLLLSFMRGQSPLCKILVKAGACLGTENREGMNIFNFKLATDQLLHKLLDLLPQESPWAECDLCQECTTRFTLTMRKHHCRHCGRVLCSKCSSNDVPIIKFGINKPVRVCGVCFNVLQCGNGLIS